MRANRPTASVIVPNWNGAHLLGPCLASLREQTYRPLEVIVADGASRDGSEQVVAPFAPLARFLRLPANFGFAGNVNRGLRQARGEVLLLLNNDAEAEPRWVEALIDALLSSPGIGSCASKILHFDDRARIASAGDLLRRNGLAAQRGNGEPDDGRFDRDEQVFAASGGAVAFHREMLEDVGLFDEGFRSYLEDVDLGLRARLRGWTCQFVPHARVYHRVSATGGGPLASYFVGRNTVRLIIRGFPGPVLRRCWREIVSAQLDRAADALSAWRGAAARATLRGQTAGLLSVPDALRSRRQIQSRRTISARALFELLAP
jgi:GT2 family glycosyltransferase